MKRAVCPGSFDPMTLGHLDVVARASELFDEVVISVLVNTTKASLFTVAERIAMIKPVVAQYPNVRVDSWSGLLVDYCKQNGIAAIVKGLRAVSDFDYELQMAQMNLQLEKVDTLFLAATPIYSFLSSSMVKEIARYGGDVSSLVPAEILPKLKARLAEAGDN